MSASLRESSAARLLATPGLAHDQAQAALAASFSVTAMAAPGALLDSASLPLFGVAEQELPEQAQALADQLTNGLCLSNYPRTPLGRLSRPNRRHQSRAQAS